MKRDSLPPASVQQADVRPFLFRRAGRITLLLSSIVAFSLSLYAHSRGTILDGPSRVSIVGHTELVSGNLGQVVFGIAGILAFAFFAVSMFRSYFAPPLVECDQGGVRFRSGRRAGYVAFSDIQNANLRVLGEVFFIELQQKNGSTTSVRLAANANGNLVHQEILQGLERAKAGVALHPNHASLEERLAAIDDESRKRDAYRSRSDDLPRLKALALDPRQEPIARAEALYRLFGSGDDSVRAEIARHLGYDCPPVLMAVAGAAEGGRKLVSNSRFEEAARYLGERDREAVRVRRAGTRARVSPDTRVVRAEAADLAGAEDEEPVDDARPEREARRD